jgi:dCMP deaminase
LKEDAKARARAAEYHKKPEYRKKQRDRRLVNLYGLTQGQYETLNRIQGGTCAICHNPPPDGENLVVDHDHKNGRVRGLLCQADNRALGVLKDSTITLSSAMAYLMRHDPRRSWDRYFMQIAEHVATRSKDPATQVGAVLVRDRNIISTGYNGFPRGVNDNIPERYERPSKYDWAVHAESNALLTAARFGASTAGTTIYVTPLAPCKECAKAISQSGVKEVVYETIGDQSRWTASNAVAKEIFEASGVLIRNPE